MGEDVKKIVAEIDAKIVAAGEAAKNAVAAGATSVANAATAVQETLIGLKNKILGMF
jgi:hypothetical protein